MKVSIDRTGCIGCGMCAATCPEVFRIAEDGTAEVIADPSAANEAAVKDAEGGCPVSVIKTES